MTSRTRAAILIAGDCLAWIIATISATVLRYDFPLREFEPLPARVMLAVGTALPSCRY